VPKYTPHTPGHFHEGWPGWGGCWGFIIENIYYVSFSTRANLICNLWLWHWG
jgi:hypothetical protein